MLKDCNLKYVNLRNIGPPEDKKNVWISFIGDSLARDIFYSSILTITG